MVIEKCLPFDMCENCDEFILSVNQQTLFYGDGGNHLVLTVECKNAEKCRLLKKNMERKMGSAETV